MLGAMVTGKPRADRVDRADRVYRVSRATARVLGQGHPWILPDDESDDPSPWPPGSRVEVVGPDGSKLGLARVEGPGPIAARMWARPGTEVLDDRAEVAARVSRALAHRRGLARRGSARLEVDGRPYTDALRLIHGEADGLPGLHVDRLGPVLRVLVSGRSGVSLVEPVVEAVLGASGWPGGPGEVVEVHHLPAADRGQGPRVAWRSPPTQDWLAKNLDERGRLGVHEGGLRFRVDLGLGDPGRPRPGTGLFLDQRENRACLAEFAGAGGDWLNLFAHTGAFSVGLLAAGAQRVVSVDLSGAYLAWLGDHLGLNADLGVDPGRHVSVRHDGRRYLATLPKREGFDGIVLDPPTAAAAGRRFWSVQRDLEPLVVEALGRLRPGGWLLVCRNSRRARGSVADLVERAAGRAGVRLTDVEDAGPGPDFPRRKAFPEGDAFRGVRVRIG
jgi:23S rRNA (cytosine1962-C5)-methyltransferase